MVEEKINKFISEKVPAVEALEGRFLFIENDTLRSNISIAFQYIIFLITLDEETELQGPITYSIYKDIIVHTATIIESCLHYCLNEYVKAGKIDSVIETKIEYKNPKQIYKIDAKNSLYLCMKGETILELKNITEFFKLNRMAKKNGILTDELFVDADKIREDRNKIHLSELNSNDNYFTKNDVEETFNRARNIIEHIEKKISELKLLN